MDLSDGMAKVAALLGGAPRVTSEGRSYPVDLRYLPGEAPIEARLDTAIRRELSKITKVTQTQKAEEPTTMGGLMNWVRSIGGSDDAKAKPAAEKPKDASTESAK